MTPFTVANRLELVASRFIQRRLGAIPDSDLLEPDCARGWLRTLTDEPTARLFIRGLAGSGKSVAVALMARKWHESGGVVLPIRIGDGTDHEDPEVWGRNLGLPGSPDAVLQAMPEKRRLVILDQVDETSLLTGLPSRHFENLRDLIASVLRCKDVRLIVTCRDADARFDSRLGGLARDFGLDEKELPSLTDKVVDGVLASRRWPHDLAVAWRPVLKTPLLLSIAVAAVPPDPKIRPSVANVFARYWESSRTRFVERAGGADAAQRYVRVLDDLAVKMATRGTTWIPGVEVEEVQPDINHLFALGVLQLEEDGCIQFFHELFQGFSYARHLSRTRVALESLIAAPLQSLEMGRAIAQVLRYRRENDISAYDADLRHLLTSSSVATHIAMAALGFLGTVADPTPCEAGLVVSWAQRAEPGAEVQAMEVLRTSAGWWQSDEVRGAAGRWRDQPEAGLRLNGIRLACHHLAREHGTLADWLRPLSGIDADAKRLVLHALTWLVEHTVEDATFELLAVIVRQGAFAPRLETGGFWQVASHRLAKRPGLQCRVFHAYLESLLDAAPLSPECWDVPVTELSDEKPVLSWADDAPEVFLEVLGDLVLEQLEEPGTDQRRRGLMRHRGLWWNHEYGPINAADLLLAGFCAACRSDFVPISQIRKIRRRLLKICTPLARSIFLDIASDRPEVVPFRAAARAIRHFNSVAVAPYLGGGTSPLDRFVAVHQGRVSGALPATMSAESVVAAPALRRPDPRRGHWTSGFMGLPAPFSADQLCAMSDEDIGAALGRVPSGTGSTFDDDIGMGGTTAQCNAVSEAFKREPERFVGVLAAPGVPSPFVAAGLQAAADVGLASALLIKLAVRVLEVEGKPGALALMRAIRRVAAPGLPSELLAAVVEIATSHPDPALSGSGGDDLWTQGMNSARGCAAEAIDAVIDVSPEDVSRLMPAIEHLVDDPMPAVRACAAEVCSALIRIHRSDGLRVAARLLAAADATLAIQQPVAWLAHSMVRDCPREIDDLVRRLLKSPQSQRLAGALSAHLACVHRNEFGGLLDAAFSSGLDARLGAADLLAQAIGSLEWAELALERVGCLFNDADEQVRVHMARTVFCIRGVAPASLERLGRLYVESRAYRDDCWMFWSSTASHLSDELQLRAAAAFLSAHRGRIANLNDWGPGAAKDLRDAILRVYHGTLDLRVRIEVVRLYGELALWGPGEIGGPDGPAL